MAAIEFSYTGDKELDRKLGELADKIQTKIAVAAVRAVARPVLRSAMDKVPVSLRGTGTLRKSLGLRQKSNRRAGITQIIVGARVGYADPATGRDPVHYAHLVELGTVFQTPQPFLRGAIAENEANGMSIFQSSIWAGIEREAAKQ